MHQDVESNFSVLENKILKLKKDFETLSVAYQDLSEEYKKLKTKYEAEKTKNQELEEQNRSIKLQASISGNPEHNRLMKAHINRLIKEVDFCIAQLQNNGL